MIDVFQNNWKLNDKRNVIPVPSFEGMKTNEIMMLMINNDKYAQGEHDPFRAQESDDEGCGNWDEEQVSFVFILFIDFT